MADLDRQAQRLHAQNALQHEAQLLAAAATQVMDAARTSRSSRYDGRQVVAAGKRERRRLIGDYVRGGVNAL